MSKKILATILTLSMLTSTAIAYGSVENGGDEKEIGQEVIQGVPGGTGEDLGGRVVSQDSEDLGGVPGGSSEDLKGIKVEVRKEQITEGGVAFGNNNYNISNSKSVDFPGTFNVDAAAGDVSGAPVRLTNTGETELIVYAEKCKSMDSTSPSIVSPNTFSDWMNLSQEETISNMALGFIINGSTTYWFDDEGSQQSEEVYRLAAGESITLAITGKCGTQWPSNCTINYDCTVGFEVIPFEKEIEVVIEQPAAPIISEDVTEGTKDTEATEVTEDQGQENNEQQEQPEQPGQVEQPGQIDDTENNTSTSEVEQQPDQTTEQEVNQETEQKTTGV